MRKRKPVLLNGEALMVDGKVLEFDAVDQEELDGKIDAPQTAQVGEVLTVEEVDEDGKPIKWKAAKVSGTFVCTFTDADSGNGLICDKTEDEIDAASEKGDNVIGVYSAMIFQLSSIGDHKRFICQQGRWVYNIYKETTDSNYTMEDILLSDIAPMDVPIPYEVPVYIPTRDGMQWQYGRPLLAAEYYMNELTDKEKALMQKNLGIDDLGFVKYTEQELTGEQQKQARKNIGASFKTITFHEPADEQLIQAIQDISQQNGTCIIAGWGSDVDITKQLVIYRPYTEFNGTGYKKYNGIAVGDTNGGVYQYTCQISSMDGNYLRFEELSTNIPQPPKNLNGEIIDYYTLKTKESSIQWVQENFVQSDWTQNDRNARDYIRNRPGGYDIGEDSSFEWNGSDVLGGFFYVSSNIWLVKVSDLVLSKSEFENRVLYMNSDPSVPMQNGDIYEGDGYFQDAANGVVVATKENATPYGPTATLTTPGIYFVCRSYNDVKAYVCRMVISNVKKVKIPYDYLDVDTYLSTKLPSPATAQPGQIVKVKAVDESGKITETEAVDMPMQKTLKWITVHSSDLTETKREFIISTDTDGKSIADYNPVGLSLILSTPADATVESNNGSPWVYPSTTKGDNAIRVIGTIAGWKTIARDSAFVFNGGSSAMSCSGNVNTSLPTYKLDGYALDGVRIFFNSTNDHLPVGTHVEVAILCEVEE